MLLKTTRAYSFKKRIIYLIFTSVLTLVFTFTGIINSVGVFDKLYVQSYRDLTNTVNITGSALSESIESIASNVNIVSGLLSNTIMDLADEAETDISLLYTNPQLMEEILEISAEYLAPLLHEDLVSGAFALFNLDETNEYPMGVHSGVYLRQYIPHSIEDYYPGLYIYDTTAEHIVNDIYLTSLQRAHVVLDPNSNSYDYSIIIDLYSMFLELVESSTFANIVQVGYWTEAFNIFPDTQEGRSQFYLVPLIDRYGNMYGIYGIELSEQRVIEILYKGLNINEEHGFYVLGYINDDMVIEEMYITQDYKMYPYALDSLPIILRSEYISSEEEKIYTIINVNGEDEKYYAGIDTINFYKHATVHEEPGLSIIGFLHESEVRRTYTSSRNWVFASIAISGALSLSLVLFISWSTIKKITELSKYINGFQGTEEFNFSKTNLQEIDELIFAIEGLNKSVLESGRRISKILDMTKMSMGFFEDRYKDKEVFVTPKLLDIIGIDSEKYPDSFMPTEVWDKIFLKILSGYNKNKKNVYKWECDDNPIMFKWLKVECAIVDDRNIGVIVDVTDDILKQQKLEDELDYDSMTRLLNRNSFKRIAMEKAMENPSKKGAMIFADLDNLKYVNDTYGHETGDKYIIAAAENFSLFKELGGIIARISGDEFAIYIHGFDTIDEGREKIYHYIEKRIVKSILLPDKSEMRINSSLGISWFGKDSDDIQLLIKYADHAMYETKAREKGKVREFDKYTYEESISLLEKKESITKLIDEKLIKYAFQPIINLKDGSIYGYEALMRPITESFSSPLEIISVAGSQSKLYQVERLTISIVVDWVVNNKTLLGNKKIFINTMTNLDLTEEDLEEFMEIMLEASDSVIYEITESSFAEIHSLSEKVDKIREKTKSKVALDDFGAGYSNELMISTLKPDIVKLAPCLVNKIYQDKDKQYIVKDLVDLCKSNNVKVLAEGVELEDELCTLIKLGVDMAQGYYFAHPNFDIQENLEKEKIDKILSIINNIE